MTISKRPLAVALALAWCIVASTASAVVAGQARQNRPRAQPAPGPLAEGGVSPAEIQQLFDAYVVMRAQEELQLSDAQYPQFLSRVKALQDVRRRGQVERGRILRVLRRLAQDGKADENETRTQIQALDTLDQRTSDEIRRAVDAVDELLDVRQQARFRLFEEQMERRKVELLLRARQANRPRP